MTGGLGLVEQKLQAPKEIRKPSKKSLGYDKHFKDAYRRQRQPGYGKYIALPRGGKPKALVREKEQRGLRYRKPRAPVPEKKAYGGPYGKPQKAVLGHKL